MIIPFHYTYLIGSLLFAIAWFYIYLQRKDLRTEMLTMSILFMSLALIAEYFFWTKDYWRPSTITQTPIGIEDFILGFSNGGIVAVCYESFLKKTHRKKKTTTHKFAWSITLILCIVFVLLYQGFQFPSPWATSESFLISTAIMLWLRKDLFAYSLISGTIALLGSIPFYIFLEVFSPGFVEKTWILSSLTGITIANIPIEDFLYYFSLGCFLGTWYLLWKNEEIK